MIEAILIQDISNWDKMNSFSMIITALATVLLLVVAYFQLSNLVKNNSLKIIFDLETEICKHKMKLDEIAAKIRILILNNENQKAEIYEDELSGAEENYLNALDRLCYCINNGYLKEKDWKIEYNEQLIETIRNYQIQFGETTYYRNILNLYKSWNT